MDEPEYQIKGGFDVWMYLAYSCLSISYISVNEVMLRVVLSMASFFFIIWGSPHDVLGFQIDGFIYNFILILCNVYRLIPFIKDMLKVKLTEQQEDLYDNFFYQHLQKRPFKKMTKYLSTFEISQGDDLNIQSSGESFGSIILITHLHPNYTVELSNSEGQVLNTVNTGSWLGIIEYLKNEKAIIEDGSNAGCSWEISTRLVQRSTVPHNSDRFDPTDNVLCQYVSISLEDIVKLHRDSEFPFVFKNAFSSMWLGYASQHVTRQDQQLLEQLD